MSNLLETFKVDPSQDLILTEDIDRAILQLKGSLGTIYEAQLCALLDVQQQGRGAGMWSDPHYGGLSVLINERYFKTYAKELAAEENPQWSEHEPVWPYSCLNWNDAVKELMQDYVEIDYEGIIFYIRKA